eukprot:SAG31_NODE_3253_length_4489_cov_3.514351_4_plen_1035_part_01
MSGEICIQPAMKKARTTLLLTCTCPTRLAESDRLDTARTKDALSDIAQKLQTLEADAVASLAQEVADHKDGLHLMMTLLEESATKDELQSAAEQIAAQVHSTLHGDIVASQQQMQSSHDLLAQSIASLKEQSQHTLGAQDDKIAELQNAIEARLADMISDMTDAVEAANDHARVHLDQANARFDHSAQELTQQIDDQQKRSQALASKLTASIDSNHKDLTMATEMKLNNLMETNDNQMLTMKQRVDEQVEGVWTRLEAHLGDIQSDLRRDTSKIDTIIQQLDNKLNDHVKKLAQRFSENYRALDGQLTTVGSQAKSNFGDINSRLDLLTAEVQQWIIQYGVDRKVADAATTRIDDKVVEASSTFHGLSVKISGIEKEMHRLISRSEQNAKDKANVYESRMVRMSQESQNMKDHFARSVAQLEVQMKHFNTNWTRVDEDIKRCNDTLAEQACNIRKDVQHKFDACKIDIGQLRDHQDNDVVRRVMACEQGQEDVEKRMQQDVEKHIRDLEHKLQIAEQRTLQSQKEVEQRLKLGIDGCSQAIENSERSAKTLETLVQANKGAADGDHDKAEKDLAVVRDTISDLRQHLNDMALSANLAALSNQSASGPGGTGEEDTTGGNSMEALAALVYKEMSDDPDKFTLPQKQPSQPQFAMAPFMMPPQYAMSPHASLPPGSPMQMAPQFVGSPMQMAPQLVRQADADNMSGILSQQAAHTMSTTKMAANVESAQGLDSAPAQETEHTFKLEGDFEELPGPGSSERAELEANFKEEVAKQLAALGLSPEDIEITDYTPGSIIIHYKIKTRAAQSTESIQQAVKEFDGSKIGPIGGFKAAAHPSVASAGTEPSKGGACSGGGQGDEVPPAPPADSGAGKGSSKGGKEPAAAAGKGQGASKGAEAPAPAPPTDSGAGKGSSKGSSKGGKEPAAAAGKGKGAEAPAPATDKGSGKGGKAPAPAPPADSGAGKGSSKGGKEPAAAAGKGKGAAAPAPAPAPAPPADSGAGKGSSKGGKAPAPADTGAGKGKGAEAAAPATDKGSGKG